MTERVRPAYLLLFFCWILSNATMLVAQTTTIYRPSAYKPSNYNNPRNAFDGNSTTYSLGNGSGYAGACCAAETWYGFSAAAGTPTSIKLKVTSQVGGTSPCTALLQYAMDGGGNPLTYTSIYALAVNRSQRTDDITLSNSQDLTKVVVYGQVNCPNGSQAGIQQLVYEIWIEVTT